MTRSSHLLCNAALLLAACLPLAAVDDSAVPQAPSQPSAKPESTLHSWELPAITITGQPKAEFADDDLVGSYGQPRWSTERLFTEVRTYVIPEGQAEFEYWLFITQPSKKDKDDAAAAGQPKPKPSVRQQFEAELGLGHRLQLDLYQVFDKDGSNGTGALHATKFEIRYAFFDWDKCWGNPTAYVEWEQAESGADSAEVKLLTCGNIAPRWVWANNLVWEQQTGDLRERSQEINTAVSYTALEEKLNIGGELALARVSALQDSAGSTRDSHNEAAFGPSIRYRPINRAHVILSALFGLNKTSAQEKTALIIGWEF